MRWLVLVVLVVVALAGCGAPAASPVKVVPFLPHNDAQPGRGTEFAFFVESLSAFKQTLPVRVVGLPDKWGFEPENASLTLPGKGASSLIVRITPDRDATYGPRTLGVLVGETRADVIVNVKDLGREHARAGAGVQVRYVLWWTNGTLIETNDPVARQQPIPGARPAEGNASDRPLKVFVGGQRGTPPPEPYNSTGCDAGEDPPCYHPVIPGFDARLRDAGDGSGMVAGETLAVRVPAALAYTYSGNEDHPLFGQDLQFLVRVVSVDVFNPRSCPLPVCP